MSLFHTLLNAMTAINRIGYHGCARSAKYELKVSSDLKALLCDAPGAAATPTQKLYLCRVYSVESNPLHDYSCNHDYRHE